MEDDSKIVEIMRTEALASLEVGLPDNWPHEGMKRLMQAVLRRVKSKLEARGIQRALDLASAYAAAGALIDDAYIEELEQLKEDLIKGHL